ncbi:MAG: L,D-transpeptidase family protein [Bacteroidaceae bacterium]|nr:L,D-transpeptidase family protein [Bacteroidaceae bacterium]
MPRKFSAYLILPLLFSLQLAGCKGALDFMESGNALSVDTLHIRSLCREMALEADGMYADTYVRRHFDTATVFTFFSPEGLQPQARRLMDLLRDAPLRTGLPATVFGLDEMPVLLDSIDSLCVRRDSVDAATLLATTEFRLTRALLRYAYGMRYGFLRPRRFMNRLLADSDGGYRRLFDLPVEQPDEALAAVALRAAQDDDLAALLDTLQPPYPLYDTYREAYARATEQGDARRQRLLRINMERARWRYPRPRPDSRHVFVNMAGAMLEATDGDTLRLRMRVVVGSQAHKTPLLMSRMGGVELNPYWVVPSSIIRKEIIPNHLGDSAYFARNRMHALNRETQEETDPALLSESELRSGRYLLRQAKGEGNSLGRMVFRFKNNHAVYLHDTNNRGAFERSVRTLSHGCVRLQRPLDLALFLLGEKAQDELYADRLRLSIGLPPLSARGKQYQAENPEAEPWHHLSFPRATPLWLDYYTLWPDADGVLQAQPDTYHYDQAIERLLNKL